MSWPNTSTRPSSSVRRPHIRRMSVDLPEPLAPRIPTILPRSRRIETFEIAVTGFFLRPTMNRFVTPSTRRAGVAVPFAVDGSNDAGRQGSRVTIGRAVARDQRCFFGCLVVVVVTVMAPSCSVRRWAETARAAGPMTTSRRVGSRLWWMSCLSLPAGHQKSRGPSGPRLVVRSVGGPTAGPLPRVGRRSPAIGSADGRRRVSRVAECSHSESPSC